ncbi:MAG: dihydropteroate synthase-like protein [Archaeoglobaceae archaeon]
MNILALTGKLAQEEVKKYVENVYVVDIDVAAFISPSDVKDIDLSGYNLVFVPGMAKGDWAKLEEEKGVKIRLGPIHASDLKTVMENIRQVEFSHTVPACKLLNISKAHENTSMVDSLQDSVLDISKIRIGGNTRMKVVAEVVDATEITTDELVSKLQYYESEGADIIDLGIPVEHSVEDVKRSVKTAIGHCNTPISIDTFNKKAIAVGVEAGADMVMSISGENLDALDSLGDAAVVVVDYDINNLIGLIEKVKQKTDRIIADCLLEPQNISGSLYRYQQFRKTDGETPVLMGVGNVTELSDADSLGINATLAFIAEELSINMLFTTEASLKTRGCIRELRTASYMSKAAKLRNTPPKDLGIDLLSLKEKNSLRTCGPPDDYIQAFEAKFVRDPYGDFRIWIHNGKIVCSHERLTVVGDDAKSISDTVVENNLVSRSDHAAYLGRELKKAEIALKLGKNYVQDRELSFGIYSSTEL